MPLSEIQIDRYSRQIILPQIGGRGQERLLAAAVAVVGAGELAGTVARYLAGAGIGRIDLYYSSAALRPETLFLRADLEALNPDVRTAAAPLPDPVRRPATWLEGYDAAALCDAEPAVVELVSRATAAGGTPVVAGGANATLGWLARIGVPPAPCAACAEHRAREVIATSAAAAFEPATAGVVGSLQALEILKALLGVGSGGAGSWLLFDAEASTLEERTIRRRADCGVCAATL